MKAKLLILAAMGVGLLLPDLAGAAGRVRLRAGGGVSGTPELSRPQLRTCLVQQNFINTDADRIEARSKQLDALEARVVKLQADLEVKRASVNSSRTSVNRFNADAKAVQAEVDEHNLAIRVHNNQASHHGFLVDKFNDECAKKTYLDRDLQTLAAELGYGAAVRP